MSRTPRSRELTKQATRDALIAAAALQFAEQGIEGASLNAICARAGFTRGAFYVHFRDREDLLVAVMERVLGGFVEVLTAASDAGGDLERIVTTIAIAIAAAAPPLRGGPSLRFHDVLAACELSPVIRERYSSVLQRAISGVARAAETGQRKGTVRADLDARGLAQLLVTSTLGLISASEVKMPIDPNEIARMLLQMIAPTVR